MGLPVLHRSCAMSVEPGEPLGIEKVMVFFLVGSAIDVRHFMTTDRKEVFKCNHTYARIYRIKVYLQISFFFRFITM